MALLCWSFRESKCRSWFKNSAWQHLLQNTWKCNHVSLTRPNLLVAWQDISLDLHCVLPRWHYLYTLHKLGPDRPPFLLIWKRTVPWQRERDNGKKKWKEMERETCAERTVRDKCRQITSISPSRSLPLTWAPLSSELVCRWPRCLSVCLGLSSLARTYCLSRVPDCSCLSL